jgi:hypothetical protein
MTTITDNLISAFEVAGVVSSVAAFTALAHAQEKVARAEEDLQIVVAKGQLLTNAGVAAARKLHDANITLAKTMILTGAGMLTAGVVTIATLQRMTAAYVRFGNEVMNVQDMTGASAKDAARALTLMQVAGVNDIQTARELLRLNQAVFNPTAMTALAKLGISPNPNQSGLELMEKVFDRLQKMPNSMRKTGIMEDIFGVRGVAAILPVLRMSREQRQQVYSLADSYNTRLLPAVQQTQFAFGMLGQTIMMQLIFPIAEKLLPLFGATTQALVTIIAWVNKLDQTLGGVFSWVVAIVAALAGFALAARGIAILIHAIKLLNIQLGITALLKAAVTGDMRAVAMVAAVAGIAIGASIWAHYNNPERDSKEDRAAQKMERAVDKFESAVNRMVSGLNPLHGNGVPSGLKEIDIMALNRMVGLGAIG